jgi:hypothetical protein
MVVPTPPQWRICTPTIFRFLPSEYVDQFFADGSLRLSSFPRFKQHRDEQRLDATEGKTLFVHRTQQRSGQTIMASAYHGDNAYVLSAAMRCDRSLMTEFQCDSYIRIGDPTRFGQMVARHVPGLLGGAEGPCLYQENKIIECDLGYIDIAQFTDSSSPSQPSKERLERFINDQMKHYPFFLKHNHYSHQIEYRFLWFISGTRQEFLDIKVPEAIPICARPNRLTE